MKLFNLFRSGSSAPVGTSDPAARMIAIGSGQSLTYDFQLPDDHPAGLYWYHPHHHGSATVQVGGGMAGLILVKGAIDDVLEILSTPLLGIIPEGEEVLRASNLGSPVTLNSPLSAPARAYFDAASRLKGEQIPMVIPSANQGFLNKLFGRKAA